MIGSRFFYNLPTSQQARFHSCCQAAAAAAKAGGPDVAGDLS